MTNYCSIHISTHLKTYDVVASDFVVLESVQCMWKDVDTESSTEGVQGMCNLKGKQSSNK